MRTLLGMGALAQPAASLHDLPGFGLVAHCNRRRPRHAILLSSGLRTRVCEALAVYLTKPLLGPKSNLGLK